MTQMRAILIKNGKSDSAKDLYLGEAERPTLKEGDGRIIVKVRPLLHSVLGEVDADANDSIRYRSKPSE
jgi:hypothetical protein